MATYPAMPPHDRFFARLIRFECACPSCGRMLASTLDQGQLNRTMLSQKDEATRPKPTRRHSPIRTAKQLVWNPLTQRLTCPWCKVSFIGGLLLYPVKRGRGGTSLYEAPPDTRPNRHERQELRRLAGGYCTDAPYRANQQVNGYVQAVCCCPDRLTDPDCPVHRVLSTP